MVWSYFRSVVHDRVVDLFVVCYLSSSLQLTQTQERVGLPRCETVERRHESRLKCVADNVNGPMTPDLEHRAGRIGASPESMDKFAVLVRP